MAKARKSGRTVLSMREISVRAKNMARGHISGVMEVPILEDGSIIILMGLESTSGLTDEAMKALGKTISSMDVALTNGQMAESMKESMLTTRNKVLVSTIGLTANVTKVNGS
jgi:hypothetical protein